MSAAAKPDPKSQPLAPGIALKFCIDGMDSVSLVSMYSVDGQSSWNFFANDFTNHIPAVTSASLIPLAAKFHTATDYVQAVGLSAWSQFEQTGVPVTDPVFPFSLRFHPTGEIEFPSTYSENNYYLDDLKTVKSGTTLYEVYGMSAPSELGGHEFLIGDLVTTSDVTSSLWGDDHLFYRHQMTEDDIALKPEWKPYYPVYSIGSGSASVDSLITDTFDAFKAVCPFAYLWQ